MGLPPHSDLRRKAALAVRGGDFRAALGVYRQLEKRLPEDPIWPERRADAHRELGQTQEELACLLRALELQVSAGRVLPAIASCNRILEIEPDHPSTLECLHLLYTEPAVNPGTQLPPLVQPDGPPEAASDSSAAASPLFELELRDVIPGAHGAALPSSPEQNVAEIPLKDEIVNGLSSPALDLQLGARPRRSGQGGAEPADPPPSAARALSATPLFGSLPPAILHDLMTRVRVVRMAAGEVLFRQGDPADTLYVVVDGAVVPIAEGATRKRLAVIETGEFFGEIGLVTNQPRNATIEALVETRLLAIDRALMWSLLRGRPEMFQLLLRFLRERLVDRQLRTNPFFVAFGRAERADVARQFRFLEVRDGGSLVEQGRPVEGLFVVLAGELDVLDPREQKTLGSLGPGELFGAQALLQSRPAAFSVEARGKCWVLVLGEGRFRRILAGNPRLEPLLGRLARRAASERYLI